MKRSPKLALIEAQAENVRLHNIGQRHCNREVAARADLLELEVQYKRKQYGFDSVPHRPSKSSKRRSN